MLKPTFLDIDESSNGMVQGLNLSSTTMILFDEVSTFYLALDIDESSNGMVQGLNLSSTTMILFDEVSF